MTSPLAAVTPYRLWLSKMASSSASKAVVALALLGPLMMALNTSMPYQICSLDEETQLYQNNDDGIPVDDELMVETWYDLSFG